MPVKDSVNTANFNRRIAIQQKPRVDDGSGGDIGTWATIYSCWADIQNFPHGKGLFRKYLFMQLYPQMTAVIQIRFQKSVQIDATMRIEYIAHGVTHHYKILGVENPYEANVSMYILCMEDQAKAVN